MGEARERGRRGASTRWWMTGREEVPISHRVRTKSLILAAGVIALLLVEVGYSIALQRYDANPSPFALRGPVSAAVSAILG